MNIGKSALILIDEEKITLLPKKKGLDFHIQYILERSKKNKQLRKIINQFDVAKILDNPALIQETIIKALVAKGYIVFCNLCPQVLDETNLFVGYGPCTLSSTQINNLEELKQQNINIMEMGMLDSSEEFKTVGDNDSVDLSERKWLDDYLQSVSSMPSRK